MTNFPIDVVYTWVDGSDPHVIKAKERFGIASQPIRAAHNHGEVQESITSLRHFAPWIRTIFVITNDMQKPELPWSDRIRHVTHSELFGDEFKEHLPVFNSHAIECHLHRVPGLAEHFIYFNDDTFVGAPVAPSDFFDSEGRPKFFPSRSTASRLKFPKTYSYAHLYARANNLDIMERIFKDDLRITKNVIHQAVPMRRQLFEQCWEHKLMRVALMRTSASRVRMHSDVWMIGLASQWGVQTGQSVIGHISARYIAIADFGPLSWWFKFVQRTRPKLYCINDIMVLASSKRTREFEHLIKTALPHHDHGDEQGAHTQHLIAFWCRHASNASYVLSRAIGLWKNAPRRKSNSRSCR